jgi:hypothetical protein
MNQMKLRMCQTPVCEEPCLEHRECPYELSRTRSAFATRWRRRKVVGPLPQGWNNWLEFVDRFDPWAAA